MKRLHHKTLIVVFFTAFLSGIAHAQYWEPLGGGIKGFGQVEHLETDTFHNILYVGGSFDSIGNVIANNLVVWDGSQYVKLSHEPYPVVGLAMKEDTLLCASEDFPTIHVDLYVDTTYVGSLGNFTGPGSCVYVLHDTVYIGGDFANGIEFWNDTSWETIGGGLSGAFLSIKTIGEYNGELIVGGHFSDAGGITVNNIAAWYGGEWHALGDGVTSSGYPQVYTVQEYNSKLYAGGDYESAAGILCDGIGRWDGANWDSVGYYGCGAVFDMSVANGNLYVAGNMLRSFDYCIGDRAAMFDGTAWYNLNLAKGNTAFAIAVYDSNVIAGGTFDYGVNNDTLKRIARFLGYPSNAQALQIKKIFSINPNPATSSIQIHLPSNQQTTLSIFNLLGEKVMEEKISGEDVTIDVSELPLGMYVVRTVHAFAETSVGEAKFIKQ